MSKKWIAFALILMSQVLLGSAVTWVNDGGNGWDAGEDVADADMDAIKTAGDDTYTKLVAIDANVDGVVDEATVLAANGANCSAGSYALGVSAAGAAESCTDATTEIDSVVATKSVGASTDNALARFDSTAGDIQNGQTVEDDSGNLDVAGTLTIGASEVPTCLILRNSTDTGNVACQVITLTFTCEVDTNNTCGDAT